VAGEDKRRRIAGGDKRPFETGGLLLGQIDDASRVIWVSFAPTPPPPDSEHRPDAFVHGVEGVADRIDRYQRASAGTVGFVGMWHTHPGGLAAPSPTDLQGMGRLLSPAGRAPRRALLMILGGCVGRWSPDSRSRWSAWLGGSGDPAVHAELVNRPRGAAGS
jgi:integrative and conjugative element protein (TIGR02256 family)